MGYFRARLEASVWQIQQRFVGSRLVSSARLVGLGGGGGVGKLDCGNPRWRKAGSDAFAVLHSVIWTASCTRTLDMLTSYQELRKPHRH